MSIAEKMTEIAEGQRAVYAAGYTSGQSGAIQLAEQAIQIAKGRATGYVFDTVADMNLWLEDEAHKAELVLGDNFYIRDVGVPDYWWDGNAPQQLETQKVDLTEYVKNTDYADGTVPGLACFPYCKKGEYGLIATDQTTRPGGIIIRGADYEDIKGKKNSHRPITSACLDLAVKYGLAYSTQTYGRTEQQNACKLIGTLQVIENNDNTVTIVLPSGKQKTVDLSIIEIFT